MTDITEGMIYKTITEAANIIAGLADKEKGNFDKLMALCSDLMKVRHAVVESYRAAEMVNYWAEKIQSLTMEGRG